MRFTQTVDSNAPAEAANTASLQGVHWLMDDASGAAPAVLGGHNSAADMSPAGQYVPATHAAAFDDGESGVQW